MYYLTKCK